MLQRAASGEDPATRRAELAQIADRAQLAGRSARDIASELLALPDGAGALEVHRFGWELDAWSRAVVEETAQACAKAERERAQLALGSAQADAVTRDGDRLRHSLAVLADLSEAEALEAEAGTRAGVLERSVAAERRDAVWDGGGWATGLWGRFYAGIDCSGAVKAEELASPAILGRNLPGVRTRAVLRLLERRDRDHPGG